MKWFYDLTHNPFFIVAAASWLSAQILKTIIHAIVYHKLDISRLVGDGGMPSGHSATVTSLAAMTFLRYGAGSFEFAITAFFAIIVCHDAMGVRLETGKQAVVINDLLEALDLFPKGQFSDAKLKEFVGHTPIQVIAGILLGIVMALIVHNFI